MMIHVCNRCKAKFKSSRGFDQHTCKGMRNLMEMDQDLLLRIIKKEITEEQAWAIQDGGQHG